MLAHRIPGGLIAWMVVALGLALAQTPDESNHVGKELPELKGHEGSDSTWINAVQGGSATVPRGKVGLVVLTSPG